MVLPGLRLKVRWARCRSKGYSCEGCWVFIWERSVKGEVPHPPTCPTIAVHCKSRVVGR